MLLKHYPGLVNSQAALARQLGSSGRTVYRWIQAGELDREVDAESVRYSPGPAGEFPDLTAVRIFDEIRAVGYPRGYTQVRRVRRASPGGRGSGDPVLETAPG